MPFTYPSTCMEITMGVFALLLPTGRSNLMFATVGDWGAAMVSRKWDSSSEFAQREIEDRNTMLDVATAFAAQASGADFILALGDNFYENGVNSTTDPQWEKTWRANWVDPFPQMAGVPWYPVLGNHDYHQGVQAAKTQVLRTTATDDDEWQFPSRSWSRTVAVSPSSNLVVVGIDTQQLAPSLYDGDDDETAAAASAAEGFLKVVEQHLTLAAEDPATAWLVVLGHYPLLSQGEHGDSLELCASLLPLFKAAGVDLYLSGHDHSLQHAEFQNTHFVVSGAGTRNDGYIRETSPYSTESEDPAPGRMTSFSKQEHGFTRHTIETTGKTSLMRSSFVSTSGKILHSFEQLPQCRKGCTGSEKSEASWENGALALGVAAAALVTVGSFVAFRAFRIRNGYSPVSGHDEEAGMFFDRK